MTCADYNYNISYETDCLRINTQQRSAAILIFGLHLHELLFMNINQFAQFRRSDVFFLSFCFFHILSLPDLLLAHIYNCESVFSVFLQLQGLSCSHDCSAEPNAHGVIILSGSQ